MLFNNQSIDFKAISDEFLCINYRVPYILFDVFINS